MPAVVVVVDLPVGVPVPEVVVAAARLVAPLVEVRPAGLPVGARLAVALVALLVVRLAAVRRAGLPVERRAAVERPAVRLLVVLGVKLVGVLLEVVRTVAVLALREEAELPAQKFHAKLHRSAQVDSFMLSR